MVGYKPEKETHLSPTEQAFAGAVTGAVSRALFQPFDVLKIRFQVQYPQILLLFYLVFLFCIMIQLHEQILQYVKV